MNDDACVMEQQVSSKHPSKVSFPGLPSHAHSTKTQTYTVNLAGDQAHLHEVTVLSGIPYADYFSVKAAMAVQSSSASECTAVVTMTVEFHKSTWLKGQIVSNTKAELAEVYKEWYEHAKSVLETHHRAPAAAAAATLASLPAVEQIAVEELEEDDEFFDCVDQDMAPLLGSRFQEVQLHEDDEEKQQGDGLPQYRPLSGRLRSASADNIDSRAVAVSLVEVLFVVVESIFWKAHNCNNELREYFDVPAGEVVSRALRAFLPGFHHQTVEKPDFYGPLLAVFTLPQVLLFAMDVSRHGCRRETLLGTSVMVSISLWAGLSVLYRLLGYLVGSRMHFKEILCVTGYSMYGWGVVIVAAYLLEVMFPTMKWTTTISMVVVGLPVAMAVGAAFWQRTPVATSHDADLGDDDGADGDIAMSVRSADEDNQVRRRQRAAESRQEDGDDVEMQPLLASTGELGGAPADSAEKSSPPSGQLVACLVGLWTKHCVDPVVRWWRLCHEAVTYRRNRCVLLFKRLFTRLLWLVPKLIGFVLVCATHYQFLWYLERVFLPGKKQLCAMSALLQPGDFADIITQKELLHFLSTLMDQ